MSTTHPGFAKVQSKIEGEGYSKKAAGAILASASRHASAKAKKANPRLLKVRMKAKPTTKDCPTCAGTGQVPDTDTDQDGM